MEPVKRTSYQLLTEGLYKEEALSMLRTEAEQAAVTAAVGNAAARAAVATASSAALDAGNALAAAQAAQTDATGALTKLSDIASDSFLTPDEKPSLLLDYAVMTAEQAGLDTQAASFLITTEKATYDSALSALTTYLGTLTAPVAWNSLVDKTAIVGTTFRQKWQDVYTARAALTATIYSKAKQLADGAQTTAGTALTNAATAQARADSAWTNAQTAQADATSALSTLTDIASDNVLTPDEKSAVIGDYAVLTGEQAGIDGQASAYGITTEKTAYDTAVNSLTSYLGTLTTPVAWNNTSSKTTIVGSTFRAKFQDVYLTKMALLNAIYAKAKLLADGAQSAADTANTALSDIADDNKLTPAEKLSVLLDYKALWQNKATLDAKADAVSVSRATYDTTITALQTYMVTLGLTLGTNDSAWCATTTLIDGPTFRSKFASASAEESNLINAIVAQVNTIAGNAGTTAGNALTLAGSKSQVFYRTTAPTLGPDNLHAGDVWFNTTTYVEDGRTKSKFAPSTWSGAAWVLVPNADRITASEVAAGCVTAGSMATGTLVVGNITDAGTLANKNVSDVNGMVTSIDGGVITTGTVNANRISITASRVTDLGALATKSSIGTADVTTIDGGRITTRTLVASNIAVDALSTTGYAEDGGGKPLTGARMQNPVSGAGALKVASGQLQVGGAVFTDYWYRLVMAIDGANGGLLAWRGNIDAATNGGTPYLREPTLSSGLAQNPRIQVQPRGGFYDATSGNTLHQWSVIIQPLTNNDNLEALRSVQLALYTSTGTSLGWTAQNTLADRAFQYPLSPTQAGNSFNTDVMMVRYRGANDVLYAGQPRCFNGYVRASVRNAYGVSAAVDFGPSNSHGANLPIAVIPSGGGAGPPPDGSGGGIIGGGCPAPWVKVTLASGLTVDAGDLYDGAQVLGASDGGSFAPAAGTVRNPQTIWKLRRDLALVDGRMLAFSEGHRLAVVKRGWVPVEQLAPGDVLVARMPSVVKAVGRAQQAQVVSFEVDGPHTYFAGDVLNHNRKDIP